VTRARETGFSYRRDLLEAVRAELARTAPAVRTSAFAAVDRTVPEPTLDPYRGLNAWR
jgi:hypothetical protein